MPSRTDRRDGMILQAALSDIDIDFIDGVDGKTIPDKAVPLLKPHDRLPDASIGSWRGHMNAIREIVKLKLSSALILEDDIDWDVRIKDQLYDFALSAQALAQPLEGSNQTYTDSAHSNDPEYPLTFAIPFERLPRTRPVQASPYGDNWDVLWIGHCGMSFPFKHTAVPKGSVVHRNDFTVPNRRHLWGYNEPFTLKESFQDHTSVVHHAQEGVCTFAYAVSYKGAVKMLEDVALSDMSDAFDFLLRFFCEGDRGMRAHKCLAHQPGLFFSHRPRGPLKSDSDIRDKGDGFRDKAYTDMVRLSVRLNAHAIIDGTELTDQYPDEDIL
ncbi:hypothetical protein B0I35DRAFT_423740 [Stachybotrys elegans]|uniref:Glycosyl transferase family 25 domain-containing protein n=1 Tax=Stachybotrys elegans TaxID=80388 RepID=A0A8K0WU03_9HYPO|nr:hypothetical protein B0I35DRAFT_423740 [Stachybotrys elegans]